MEADLDRIARGEADRTDWLKAFYFGDDRQPGLRPIVDNIGEIDARAINSMPITDAITLRVGKYGPFLEVDEGGEAPRRVNLPQDMAPDELTPARAQELIDAPVIGDRELGLHPVTGKMVVAKDGRFGPYVTEVDPAPEPQVDPATGEVVEAPAPAKAPARGKKAAAEKPRTASLFKDMSPETVDLETAIRLLDLPRTVGDDPESGEPITAQNGRYGPYLKKGTDTRSLDSEAQIFDIDLAGALEKFAQPKYGARKASSALKEFDADPVSGKPIKLKDGRFGPYVTDGETNATVPRGEDPMEVDFERAVQLIADKRAKGPAKKPAARKPAAKKTTTAKKPAAKKATTAKKPAAKKPATKSASTRATAAKKTPPAAE